jgi:hypothetical protein
MPFMPGYNENLNEEYKDAPVSTGWSVPDGTYQGRITEAYGEFNEYKDCNRVVVCITVGAGEHAGRVVKKRTDVLPETLGWIKSDLARAGIEIPEDIDHLEQAVESMVDAPVEFAVVSKEAKNGKTYQNVYINRAIDSVEFGDDIPF